MTTGMHYLLFPCPFTLRITTSSIDINLGHNEGQEAMTSSLEHPYITKYGFGAGGGVAGDEEADETSGVGAVGEAADDELFVDVEAVVGAVGEYQEGVGMAVAALDGAGWRPVDEGEPVVGVAAVGADEAIFALLVEFEDVEGAADGAETEDEAVDVAAQQLCLSGDDGVGELLVVGVAPGGGGGRVGLDVVALGRKETLVAIVNPATTGTGQVGAVERMADAYGRGDACCGLHSRLCCQCGLRLGDCPCVRCRRHGTIPLVYALLHCAGTLHRPDSRGVCGLPAQAEGNRCHQQDQDDKSRQGEGVAQGSGAGW